MLLFYRSFVAPLLFLLTPLEFRAGCTLVGNTVFASFVTADEADSSCCFSQFTISKSWLVPTLNCCAHFLRWEWRDWRLNIDMSGHEMNCSYTLDNQLSNCLSPLWLSMLSQYAFFLSLNLCMIWLRSWWDTHSMFKTRRPTSDWQWSENMPSQLPIRIVGLKYAIFFQLSLLVEW